MHEVGTIITTLASLIVAVAITALIVSKKAQTPQVIQAAASGFGNDLGVAEAPVTGSQVPINLSYPSDASTPWDFSPNF